jgi:hypothetical protein
MVEATGAEMVVEISRCGRKPRDWFSTPGASAYYQLRDE